MQHKLILADGEIEYDYLILAAGSITNFFGLESVKRYACDLKKLYRAAECRNRILDSFEKAVRESDPTLRRALLTFVVVGGGATGVEFAGALAELVRDALPKDYPELHVQDARVLVIEAGDRLLTMLPEKLQKYTLKRLENLGVEVLFNKTVRGAEPRRVFLQDGSVIEAHTLFWAAGVRAAPLADVLNLPKASHGRIPVQPDLTVAGHPDVFIIGDMAFLEQDGKPLPMVAQVAMQGGEYVGMAILNRERGKPVSPFRYRDKGTMAVIGRNAAAATVFGVTMSGFFAWLAWLGLHIFYLIGFRNRLTVMLDWAYAYLHHEGQVHLIIGGDETKSNEFPAT